MKVRTEQYFIKLLFGFLLIFFIFFMKDYFETNEILEKSKSMGGSYRHLDMAYFTGMVIAVAGSVYLILPSLVYFVRNILSKN